jgi:hypothetical protein
MNIMSASRDDASLVTHNDNKITGCHPRKGRYFFVAMAILFVIITAIGFGSDYVRISGTQIKVHWFTRIHGAIMTLWLLVFLAQVILAAKGKLKFHRQLGLFSVGLGLLVWLTMIIATFRPIIANSPRLDDSEWDGLLIQFYGIILFGLFFTWGILVRKKAAAHKRLLFFSTMVLMQAGIDRIPWLPGLGAAIFVRFIYLDALVVLLLIYDLVTARRIHKITGIGSMIIIIVQVMVTTTVGSPAWHQFWFNRFAPFQEQIAEVKLSDAQIEPLLGDYGDKKWHLTIRRDGGKIYLQLPDEPRFEMAPAAENEWFLRTMNWKVSFIRGPGKSVIKIINTQPNVTWEVQRMK